MKQQVRIIGGSMRGRKLDILNGIDGLRPTGDRIRETLFNWLQPFIAGSHCLDLFTGTGALAIESVSRGAESVIAFDNDKNIVKHLQNVQSQWQGLEPLKIQQQNAIDWLKAQDTLPFHIIYLDPPFALDIQQQLLDAIASKDRHNPQYIYVEASKQQTLTCPSECDLLKSKTAGNTQYHLYKCHANHS